MDPKPDDGTQPLDLRDPAEREQDEHDAETFRMWKEFFDAQD